jgi:hypothetical protein
MGICYTILAGIDPGVRDETIVPALEWAMRRSEPARR